MLVLTCLLSVCFVYSIIWFIAIKFLINLSGFYGNSAPEYRKYRKTFLNDTGKDPFLYFSIQTN